ncbi:MAG: AGE family epimerase/isomerase [Propionivibrio sp.]|uniref:AGE family epimerase/isomerase n=1 Tax=Propionivibrio sp. TaxID=2212460 RepID=UPI001B793408|nr:AGE family epimerase/isomerase [Propionivibrio sp.]MBP7201672.1 AGE family epimerase/isomerase [Propionivibrio sp.]
MKEARGWLADTFDLAEQHFWEAAAQLYAADEAGPDWKTPSSRRQNANMHACEVDLLRALGELENGWLWRATLRSRSFPGWRHRDLPPPRSPTP